MRFERYIEILNKTLVEHGLPPVDPEKVSEIGMLTLDLKSDDLVMLADNLAEFARRRDQPGLADELELLSVQMEIAIDDHDDPDATAE